jgi:hypothetical protein
MAIAAAAVHADPVFDKSKYYDGTALKDWCETLHKSYNAEKTKKIADSTLPAFVKAYAAHYNAVTTVDDLYTAVKADLETSGIVLSKSDEAAYALYVAVEGDDKAMKALIGDVPNDIKTVFASKKAGKEQYDYLTDVYKKANPDDVQAALEYKEAYDVNQYLTTNLEKLKQSLRTKYINSSNRFQVANVLSNLKVGTITTAVTQLNSAKSDDEVNNAIEAHFKTQMGI